MKQAETLLNQTQAQAQALDVQRAQLEQIEIRELPADGRQSLAVDLANLATEGDFGRDTLQEVTTTLAQALAEQPAGPEAYVTLAQLARYEHMRVALDSFQLRAAMAQLEADDQARHFGSGAARAAWIAPRKS